MGLFLTSTGVGLSAGVGQIHTQIPGVLTAHGGSLSRGTGQILSALPVGALSDFGIWDVGQPDAARSCVLGSSSALDTSWARPWLCASAPVAYDRGAGPLWARASYAALGVRYAGVPAGQGHYFTDTQVEQIQIGNRLSLDATAYATRLVYAPAPGGGALTRTSALAYTGRYAGQLTRTGAETTLTMNPTAHALIAVAPGDVLLGSVAVALPTAGIPWRAQVRCYTAAYVELPVSDATAPATHPGEGTWQVHATRVSVPEGAAYAAVVPTITAAGLPIGATVYVDMHRLRSIGYATACAPSAFTPPRQALITVRAPRVQTARNPSFDADLFGWSAIYPGAGSFPLTRDASVGRVRAGAAKFTMNAYGSAPAGTQQPYGGGGYGQSAYGGHPFYGIGTTTVGTPDTLGVVDLLPATTYTASGYILPGVPCPPVRLRVYPGNAGTNTYIDSPSTAEVLTFHPEMVDENGWIRLSLTFTTTADFNGILDVRFVVDQADLISAGATFFLDDVLVEEGTQLLSYFDGATSGEDFWWEGSAARSRSHNYPGTRGSLYRLNQIIGNFLPFGRAWNILYAQPPH